MKRPVRPPVRILAVLAAAVAIFAFGGWMSANAGAPTTSGAASSVSWCCVNGSSPGITVTGQATVHGRGTSARDDAIARAVADATDQANAAAHAAGITLGSIVDMQVSAPPYPYAVPAAGAIAEPGSSGSASGTSSASAASGTMCPVAAPCAPVAIALPYQVDASVTITWSIA
jgi:hypothetical protein